MLSEEEDCQVGRQISMQVKYLLSPRLVLLRIKMKYTVINKSLLLRRPCDQLCKIKSDINLLAFVCVISNNFPLLQIKQ